MKRAVFYSALIVGAASTTVGCPIFPDDTGCYSHYDCAPGYFCDHTTGACVTKGDLPDGTCTEPGDCGPNETCGKNSVCTVGDCSFDSIGCVAGFVCGIDETGAWMCLPGGSPTPDAGSAGAAGQDGAGGGAGSSGEGGSSQGGAGQGGAAGAGVAGSANPGGQGGSDG